MSILDETKLHSRKEQTAHWLRNHLDAVVERRVVEILHGEPSTLNRLLDSRQNPVHLLHQVSDALAHLLEAVLAPPLGLIRIQAAASALVENVAGGAGLSDQLRVEQFLRVEACASSVISSITLLRDVRHAVQLRSDGARAYASSRGDTTGNTEIIIDLKEVMPLPQRTPVTFSPISMLWVTAP